MQKPTVHVDFDGVIHSYRSGWTGIIEAKDPPVDEAKDVLQKLSEDFTVEILSTRASCGDGKRVISEYLEKHGFPTFKSGNQKTPSIALIDDRAITFRGYWPFTAQILRTFVPWNKMMATPSPGVAIPSTKALLHISLVVQDALLSLFVDQEITPAYLTSTPEGNEVFSLLEELMEVAEKMDGLLSKAKLLYKKYPS